MTRARLAAALSGLAAVVCLSSAAAAPAATGRGPEFPFAEGMHAAALAVGPDRNIWFAGTRHDPAQSADVVGRVAPDGQVVEFALPARGEAELGISSIVAGSDGYLYFTEPNANRIGRVSTGGEIFEIGLPNPGSRPRTIVAAPDGSLWVTEEGGDRIGRIDLAENSLEERQLAPGARPTGIAARADGTIWVAEPGVDGLAIVRPGEAISLFRVPFASSAPNAIVPGPEGNVWFTEENGPWLGRITAAALTKASYERFEVPTEQGTRWLAFGPSGDFWFTTGNRIGSVSPDGLMAEPACVAGGCDLPVTALAAGPEGELWYATGLTERAGDEPYAAGTIGRFLPPRATAIIGRGPGRLAGRYVKLRISCLGGAAGQLCSGKVRVLGRLDGGGGTALLGSRGLEFHVNSSRGFRIRVSRRTAALLRREGRLTVRVAITLSGGRRTSRQLVLKASGRAHGPARS